MKVGRATIVPVLIGEDDLNLYTVTDSVDEAVRQVTNFYSNYHSIRFVGNRLVIRVRTGPTDEQLAGINERYAHLCSSGGIERTDATRAERRDDDHLELDRLILDFTRHGYSDLIKLIGELNSWV